MIRQAGPGGLFEGRRWFLFSMEIRDFFRHRRAFHLFPLLLAGVYLMAWIYPVGSPFAPVIFVVLIGLEPQFNNIFFRRPIEPEAMAVLPVSWSEVILAKNLATLGLVCLLMITCSMALFYFSPEKIRPSAAGDAALYLASILPPMLCLGNSQSIKEPRRETGFRIADAVDAVWHLVHLAILSIPYYILVSLMHFPALLLVFMAGAITFWHRSSIPRTAGLIKINPLWMTH